MGVATGAWSVTPRDYSDVTVTDRDSTLSHDARDAAASNVKRDVADLDMSHATDEPACAHCTTLYTCVSKKGAPNS